MSAGFYYREYDESDHAMISEWWKSHSFPVLSKETLPKTGIIIEHGEDPVAAGFVYLSDSTVGWVEWIVSNPKANPLVRARAIPILIEELCLAAREKGCKMVITALEHPKLIDRLLKSGYVQGDVGMTHLIRRFDLCP